MSSILIICGAGASSTFLASRMRSLVAGRELDFSVTAASESDLDVRLASTDVLLVGPHLATSFDAISARANLAHVASALLPADVFGSGGAEAALLLAIDLAPAPVIAASAPQPTSTTPTPNEGILHG